MIEFLHSQVSDRKLTLLNCAGCRLVWTLLTDRRSRLAVKRLERLADDLSNARFRQDIYNMANAAFGDAAAVGQAPWCAACAVVCASWQVDSSSTWGNLARALEEPAGMASTAVWSRKAAIIRELFGNPLRPVTIENSWRTATVISLADAIYNNDFYNRLPILADALEDAGCDNADILNHCRQPGDHVRGCWAVDLVLGKQ